MTVVHALRAPSLADRTVASTDATWREAVLAGLPPVLFGLALGAFLLGHVQWKEIVLGGPTPYRVAEPGFAALILPGLLTLTLVLGGLLGGWSRVPRWSYTWVCGSVVAVLFSLVLLGDELPFLFSPTADVVLMLGLLLLVAVLAVLAAWRGTLDAGLAGLGLATTFVVAVPFGSTAGPFNRLDIGLLSVPSGLLCGACIVAYLRGGPGAKAAAIALTTVLAAVLVWGYRAVIFAVRPGFSDQSFHWKLLAFAVSGLLGPLLLAWLLDLRRQP